jgi:isopentenyl phosphate kinase
MALIFLKLGGSLITDKTRPYTARREIIDDLAAQIAGAFRRDPSLRLILGHGSGSFGHQAASKFDTRRGVSGPDAWQGFAEVWYQASSLNRMVVEAFHREGLPALTISPAASVTAHDGKVSHWDIHPIQKALENRLLPIIHGDVIFDDIRGGTILSTEALFAHLAREMHPDRILLAGTEAGVWEDFPQRTHLIDTITPDDLPQQLSGLGGSASTDVTGGMRSKVTEMLALVEELPGLEVLIFSAESPQSLGRALAGENPGTRLYR